MQSSGSLYLNIQIDSKHFSLASLCPLDLPHDTDSEHPYGYIHM